MKLDSLCSIFIILFLLFSVSCATKKDSANNKLTIQQEQAMRRQLLPKVRRDYRAYQSVDVQSYIQRLGNRLITANDLKGKPFDYTFTVVESPAVNAFAIPAGSIFVTLPLLSFVETEAELAAVISHEIAHVIAHHASKRLHEKETASNDGWAYAAGGAVAGGVGAAVVCQGQSICNEGLMSVAVGGGMAGGLLLQKYAFLANRQDEELEADRIAYEITRKAGFSVRHMGHFYERLQKKFEESLMKKSNGSSLIDNLSTHPSSSIREKQIRQLQGDVDKSDAGVVSSYEFKNLKELLVRSN